jgi:signal peptidase I
MLPTLQINDKILLQKHFFTIKKNDIVAFYLPQNPDEKFIKRCVGISLDTLFLNEKGNYDLIKNKTKNTDYQYFIIPKKNLTLTITLQNLSFYKPLIEQSEDGQIGLIGTNIYINGEVKSTYTFQQNYYFMLGDNPNESYDSRQWGLISEAAIFGKMIKKIVF